MTSLAALLRYQIAYMVWADTRLFGAASSLGVSELEWDFKSSERTIRGTLAHLCRAERIWICRIKGISANFKEEGDDTMEVLSARWPAIGDEWLSWSESMSDDVAADTLSYEDLRHKVWTHPVWKIVLHVVNHSTHHRGQAIGFLRALGHTPPNTDSITFAREGH